MLHLKFYTNNNEQGIKLVSDIMGLPSNYVEKELANSSESGLLSSHPDAIWKISIPLNLEQISLKFSLHHCNSWDPTKVAPATMLVYIAEGDSTNNDDKLSQQDLECLRHIVDFLHNNPEQRVCIAYPRHDLTMSQHQEEKLVQMLMDLEIHVKILLKTSVKGGDLYRVTKSVFNRIYFQFYSTGIRVHWNCKEWRSFIVNSYYIRKPVAKPFLQVEVTLASDPALPLMESPAACNKSSIRPPIVHDTIPAANSASPLSKSIQPIQGPTFEERFLHDCRTELRMIIAANRIGSTLSTKHVVSCYNKIVYKSGFLPAFCPPDLYKQMNAWIGTYYLAPNQRFFEQGNDILMEEMMLMNKKHDRDEESETVEDDEAATHQTKKIKC